MGVAVCNGSHGLVDPKEAINDVQEMRSLALDVPRLQRPPARGRPHLLQMRQHRNGLPRPWRILAALAVMTDDELSVRIARASINEMTKEFVPLVMAAHRAAFDQGVVRARQGGSGFSASVAPLGDDFCISYRPDGLCWQMLVGPEQNYLFELTHMDRWIIYRLGNQVLEPVSYDGGPMPEMPLADLQAVAVDVKRRLGEYLRLYRIVLPEDTMFAAYRTPT
jgi:hypothetical protein